MHTRVLYEPAETSDVRFIWWAIHTWIWLVLGVVFVALELWIDPLLASFVVCLKLGWKDMWATWRLRRFPQVHVARALGCYLLAYACFKIAIGSVLLASLTITVEVALGAQLDFGRLIIGLPLVVLTLFAGWFLVGLAAGHSVNQSVPIWLDGTIYEQLAHEPPQIACHGAFNRVPFLLILGIILVTLVFGPAPLTAIVLLVWRGLPWGIPGGIVFSLIWYLFAQAMYRALRQTRWFATEAA
jgi:hypothetical protein